MDYIVKFVLLSFLVFLPLLFPALFVDFWKLVYVHSCLKFVILLCQLPCSSLNKIQYVQDGLRINWACDDRLYHSDLSTLLCVNFQEIPSSHWEVQIRWHIWRINIRDYNCPNLVCSWSVVTSLVYIWIDCSVVRSWCSDRNITPLTNSKLRSLERYM